MKITVFTSNQPRHINFVNKLSCIADVYAFIEVNTIHPGNVRDFYSNSPIMKDYFDRVKSAEEFFFGGLAPTVGAKIFSIKDGDLSQINRDQMDCALDSDLYLVFGSSYIKGWLAEFLIEKGAINIHMGISPYYRGSSCNFWALYDGNPSLVGATIHLLSKGLDSGPILYHVRPKCQFIDRPFLFTMNSVVVAQESIIEKIQNRSIFSLQPKFLDRTMQIRYSRGAEFTDEVISKFLITSIEKLMEDEKTFELIKA